MNKKIGFIGSGNMASAMIGGLFNSKLVQPQEVIVSDTSLERLSPLKEKYGVNVTDNNKKVAEFSDIIILAVKPDIYKIVIEDIKHTVKPGTVIVSIAAGISIKYMEEQFEKDTKIIRTMPNTAAMVGESMTAICPNKLVEKEDLEFVMSIFNSFGKAEQLPEKYIDAVIAVSGSSPAYVFMFIEAMADAAVIGGMPRDKAYKFAAQAVLGAAKMVLETGKHPGELKDMVCSPAGTTIDAVYSLEKSGFRGTVIESMVKCMDKCQEMSKKK